jgi:gamma-glutamyltranspeptidase / glutathione hydrolase
MQSAVAAGHPATTAAGIEILEDGGTAADAAVAATFASCVAETVMTGLLGGGHGIYFDASTGRSRNLDCFVAVPGLGAGTRDAELLHLQVPFGAELVHYAVGPASCAVPGLPAGLVTLWREYGRLAWPRLLEPAIALARDGVDFPRAHAACLAMLAPVMTMNEGAEIYSPGGRLLQTGERLRQPGLAAALEAVAAEPESVYSGALAEELLALCTERGGLVTREDLAAYEARWTEPLDVPYLSGLLLTRGGLSLLPETVPRLPQLHGLGESDRVLALVSVLEPTGTGGGDTTNVTVVDGDGNACVLTSSLGLGSGDFLPGLDLHLNSMLGEADLLRGRLDPGERMESMMAPTLAVDGDGLSLAAGAAGGTRLRTALLGVIAGILDEGLDAEAAVRRPRFHPAPDTVNAEPGVDEAALAELEARGRNVRRWPEQHHYFGGVSVVSRSGSAGDPRRSGAAARPR